MFTHFPHGVHSLFIWRSLTLHTTFTHSLAGIWKFRLKTYRDIGERIYKNWPFMDFSLWTLVDRTFNWEPVKLQLITRLVDRQLTNYSGIFLAGLSGQIFNWRLVTKLQLINHSRIFSCGPWDLIEGAKLRLTTQRFFSVRLGGEGWLNYNCGICLCRLWWIVI